MAELLYESYYGVAPLDANVIEHHGVHGQKWHHRRWQNEDGSLTPAGRIHYGVGEARNKARTDKDARKAAKAEKKAAKAESKEQRMWLGGPTKEKFIEMAKEGRISTKAIEKQFDKLSLSEIRQIQNAAKENKEKEQAISSILKERRGEAEAARDLKRQQKEAKQEAAKEAAIKAGDAEKIAKYAKTMTTDELQSALDRVNKVNTLNQKAIDQAAEKRAKAEARRADIEDKVTGFASGVKYLINAKKKGEKVSLGELKKAAEAGREARNIKLTGRAKEAWEKNVTEAAGKEATKLRENIIKYTGNKRAAEQSAKALFSTMLKDVKGDSKSKKADELVDNVKNERIKKEVSLAYKKALKNGGSEKDAEEAAKKEAKKLFNADDDGDKTITKSSKLRSSLASKNSEINKVKIPEASLSKKVSELNKIAINYGNEGKIISKGGASESPSMTARISKLKEQYSWSETVGNLNAVSLDEEKKKKK